MAQSVGAAGAPVDPSHATETRTPGVEPEFGSVPVRFAQFFNSPGAGWEGADATYSVPLPDGRTLWTFGDTWLSPTDQNGAPRQGDRFVNNTAVIQDGSKLTTVFGGTPARPDSFLRPTTPGEFYWPGDATVEGDDRLQMFVNRVQSGPNGGWDAVNKGTDLITMRLPDLRVVNRRPVSWDPAINWGVAIAETDDHTYFYGMKNDGGWDRSAYVARAPQGRLATAPYEYWTGRRWSTDAKDARPIANRVSDQYSVTKTEGGWAMVNQEVLGRGVWARTAESPEGPWSEPRQIATLPAPSARTVIYNGMLHPEFSDHGKMLFSYNRNSDVPGDVANTRPGWVSIPTERLEPR